MKFIILIIVTLFSTVAFSQEPILINTEKKDLLNIGKSCKYLLDEDNKFTKDFIGKEGFESQFKVSEKEIINLGYTPATVWIRLRVSNIFDDKMVLEIDNPRINKLECYLWHNEKFIKTETHGDNFPEIAHIFYDPNPIIRLPKIGNDTLSIYLKVKSSEDLKFPMNIWQQNELYEHYINKNLIWGIYFGFILLISLYNFSLWLSTSDKSYLFYIFNVLSWGLMQADLYGFLYKYAWGNHWLNDRFHIVCLYGVNLFTSLFTISFLNLKRNLPFGYKLLTSSVYVCIIFMVFTLLFYDWYHNIIGVLLAAIQVFFIYYITIVLIIKRLRIVRFYILATLMLSFSIFIVILKNLGILSAENQDYYLMVGSMVEIVLFSLALGDKFKQTQEDRVRQQHIRDEISANLHDDLAASLSSLTMFSELNRLKTQKNAPEYAIIFTKISEKSREILNLVRENVWDMNPKNDESEEWLDRTIKFVKETLEAQQIELNLMVDETLKETIIPIDKRRDFYLFIKETINNIAKHSEAKHVDFSLNRTRNEIKLVIKDNGKGFDTNLPASGNGLINLQNRAASLEAIYKMESMPNKGTTIWLSFRIPTTISS